MVGDVGLVGNIGLGGDCRMFVDVGPVGWVGLVVGGELELVGEGIDDVLKVERITSVSVMNDCIMRVDTIMVMKEIMKNHRKGS